MHLLERKERAAVCKPRNAHSARVFCDFPLAQALVWLSVSDAAVGI